jgi:hypothetical protein
VQSVERAFNVQVLLAKVVACGPHRNRHVRRSHGGVARTATIVTETHDRRKHQEQLSIRTAFHPLQICLVDPIVRRRRSP